MKKEKRKIKYFIIILIIIIGILPAINFYQYAIKYDFKKLFNTDKVEMYVNYGFYKVLNRSLEQESVIIGKNDFLFLGNKYSKVLHKTQGIYKYKEKDIDNWTNKLKGIQTWYEDRGIKFVIVIAPNKHSVYKDKLPRWINNDNITITDTIMDYSRKKDINILDLREILTMNKTKYDNLLYLKTDTHWNGLGASIGYNETINFINKKYQMSYDYVPFEYTYHDDRGKDLSNFLKISNILPNNHEESIWFKFNKNHDVCIGNIDKKTHQLKKCKVKDNPRFSINGQPQYTINDKPINKQNALILCDSFGTHNSQLYNASFNNVWKFHHGHIYGNRLSDFVTKHKPDIVIYQVVERALYSNRIVKKLSNINIINYNNNGSKLFDINNIKYKYHKNNRLTIKDKKLITTHVDPIIILNELKTKSKFVRLNYNLDSSVKTHFQLFYKENKSSKYNENDSYRVAIKKGNNKISLSIPSKYINNNLRVDLVGKIGQYKVNDFSIYEIE
ncbi:MAG: hypothetical protein JJV94_07075 [Sulfurospirillum sp.]|nr:hypothetical protein [Sulfurospirillum sp.]